MNTSRDEQFAVEYMKLMDVYYHLAGMQNIQDMKQYSADWLDLSRRFEAIGAKHNAAMCKARGEDYGREAGGEYVRIIEGSFSELISLSETG